MKKIIEDRGEYSRKDMKKRVQDRGEYFRKDKEGATGDSKR